MFNAKFFFMLSLSFIVGVLVTFVAILLSSLLYALTLGPASQEEVSSILAMFYLVIVWILLVMTLVPRDFLPKSRGARTEMVIILLFGMVAHQFTPMIEGSLLILSTLLAYHALVMLWRSDDQNEKQ